MVARVVPWLMFSLLLGPLLLLLTQMQSFELDPQVIQLIFVSLGRALISFTVCSAILGLFFLAVFLNWVPLQSLWIWCPLFLFNMHFVMKIIGLKYLQTFWDISNIWMLHSVYFFCFGGLLFFGLWVTATTFNPNQRLVAINLGARPWLQTRYVYFPEIKQGLWLGLPLFLGAVFFDFTASQMMGQFKLPGFGTWIVMESIYSEQPNWFGVGSSLLLLFVMLTAVLGTLHFFKKGTR